MLSPSQILGLRDGEEVILHRGQSAPLCPFAEGNYIVAKQLEGGIRNVRVGLYLAIINISGQIELRLVGPTQANLKRNVEKNAIILDANQTGLNDWWCHVLEFDELRLGLLGRPNTKRVQADYKPPFPHEKSTTRWKEALEQLPSRLEEYAAIERELRHPYLAQAYDSMQSPLDASAPHGSGWIFNC